MDIENLNNKEKYKKFIFTQYINAFDELVNNKTLDIDEKINRNNELIKKMGIMLELVI